MKYEEYEMPEDYKRNLETFAEMLKERENYTKIIPNLPTDKRRQVEPILKRYDKNLDTIEQKLSEEYEGHQKRERNKDEKGEALLAKMEQIFIVAKHRFPPEKFKEYETNLIKKWDDEFKAYFYERIALRESYDLHNILAELRPKDGTRYKPPMKHPSFQLKEAIYEINLIAYEQPEEFKELMAEFEVHLKERKAAANRIKFANPRRHPAMKSHLAFMDSQLEDIKIKLMDFLAICLKEDGKIEIENPDQKKLDEAMAKADVAQERVFIMYKHAIPHLFEEFIPIATSAYQTPEEIEEFYERIAKREEEELGEILRSVGAV